MKDQQFIIEVKREESATLTYKQLFIGVEALADSLRKLGVKKVNCRLSAQYT